MMFSPSWKDLENWDMERAEKVFNTITLTEDQWLAIMFVVRSCLIEGFEAGPSIVADEVTPATIHSEIFKGVVSG